MSDSTPTTEARNYGIGEKIPKGYQGEGFRAGVEPARKRQKESREQDNEARAGRLARVPIEELVYYANHQRREYDMHSIKPGGKRHNGWFKFLENNFGPDHPDNPLIETNHVPTADELERERIDALNEFEMDKADARKKLRTASWGMMFYLITTDVIGPFNSGYAISTVGYAGGIMLYFTLGLAAYYSSFLLLNLYLRLDSNRHPIQSYGELMECFFGTFGNYLVSTVQVVQIFFIVGSNVLANAQGMTQLTAPHGSLCFIVSIVIWTIIGFVISVPFRSLSKLSHLALFNVFINITVICISMGFIAHSPPNYVSAAAAYGYTEPYAPIAHSATGTGPLSNQVNGAMNMVFGWSGLMIFVEFMNEMRKPSEFVKSFTFAELLVFIIYITYGCYVYGFQGQYTLPVSFQGVSKYSWQSVGNGLSLWTYTMASVTYLNIAVKVLYWFIFGQLFRGPPLMSKMGFIYWTGLQLVSWVISFFIGSAIPQVQTLQALIGAACLLQFSYTWPPLMQLAFDVHADASKQDEIYHPVRGVNRKDTWRTWARWRRGLFTGRVWFKALNLCFMLAALATCGLGMWGSVLTIKETFKESAATSFGCSAPV